MKTGVELVRNISVACQVWMQNMIRVRFDAVEKIIIRGGEQVGNSWLIISAVSMPLAAP